MTTPTQREVIHNKTADMIKRAAGDNDEAFDYLAFIFQATRVIDDVVDNDKEINHKSYFTCMENLCVRLHTNKFFTANYGALVSQHVTIWNTWLAANHAEEKGDLIDKVHARTWRLYIDELLPLVALLTQGYEKMKELDNDIRVFTALYHRMDPPDFNLEEVLKDVRGN